jgi:hypothetical protein
MHPDVTSQLTVFTVFRTTIPQSVVDLHFFTQPRCGAGILVSVANGGHPKMYCPIIYLPPGEAQSLLFLSINRKR